MTEMLDFEDFRERYEKVSVEEYPNNVREAVPEPMVSVHLITYNHADYIEEAIESVLMQEVDFPMEIVLGDDDSSDGTREICIEYAKKYPDLIRLQLHDRENNIHLHGQPTHLFQYWYNTFIARGKYISVLSGDDYWTDKKNLRIQNKSLENRDDLCMSFNDAEKYEDEKRIKSGILSEKFKGEVGKENLLVGWSPPASTMFFVNVFSSIPSCSLKSINEDKIISSVIGFYGKAKYEEEIYNSVYRSHEYNIWNRNKKEINHIHSHATYCVLKNLNERRGFLKESKECEKMRINSKLSLHAIRGEPVKMVVGIFKLIKMYRSIREVWIESGRIVKYIKWVFGCVKKRIFKLG